MMKIKALNMETDASGVGLWATLMQTREGASCLRKEAPDNNMQQ